MYSPKRHPFPRRRKTPYTEAAMKKNASASSSAAVSPCRAVGLVCEFLTNPLGLETKTPRLSWRLEDSRLDARQTAYRLVASSSSDKLAAETYDLWDTGRVDSSDTLDIVYAGKKLKSRSAAFWRVMVWDKDGRPSPCPSRPTTSRARSPPAPR